jgi:sterol desaturase/sphingolipid hydroxylase (fatty acid hydroxylase superfamily)
MISEITSHATTRLLEAGLGGLNDSNWRSLMILAVIAALLAIEAPQIRRERRQKDYRQSYLANFGSLFLNDILLSLLSVSSLWMLASRYSGHGLLSGIDSGGVKALAAFILLDFTLYLWHRANHHFEWLWLFHKVHHSDRVMNVSTAFRLHFGEVFLTALVKAAFIVVMGVDATLVLANEAFITLWVLFHHTPIRLRGERWLGRLFTMPYLHRTHHSSLRDEHDANYGAALSLWDRLFGTLCEAEPQALGLRDVPGQSLFELLRFGLTLNPFPDRKALGSEPVSLGEWIAKAAYFRAEKRGFAPGYDLNDWLEAEREYRDFGSQH